MRDRLLNVEGTGAVLQMQLSPKNVGLFEAFLASSGAVISATRRAQLKHPPQYHAPH